MQNSPEPIAMWHHSSPAYWAEPVLGFWLRGWVFRPAPIVPDALLRPFPQRQPAQYGCLDGEQAGYLWLVAAPDSSLPWHQEYPNQHVPLVVRHLHGRGDSQSTRG